ncbi:phosphatase [uncultured Sphingomonas sp.]|uniref:phosphatase n=1 Tax=uncultured Sphingomonas sp. TaxID=158754 RepID=UPI0025E71D50|nr:phosphatase [uncultured Sphingomonas sp.]
MTVAEAEARAAEARERMNQTASRIQARLEPQALAAQAKEAGMCAARSGIETAKNNPATVAGGVAVLGLLLNRRRIARLFIRKR